MPQKYYNRISERERKISLISLADGKAVSWTTFLAFLLQNWSNIDSSLFEKLTKLKHFYCKISL